MDIVKRTDLTLSGAATPYGCCGLFDLCTDPNLMQLNVEGNRLMGASLAGSNKFLDWLTWPTTNECIMRKSFITFVRPDQSRGVCTEGYLADPCADPNGFEWGTCDFELRDFARLRRKGPVRDITENRMVLCKTQPRYRLDGTIITSEKELDMVMATEVIIQDLKRMTIDGNATTAGQFDGLQQLVRTGYTDPSGKRCSSMDSLVIDWNGNNMSGGNGITWNGAAVANTFDFVEVLAAVVRHIRQNIGYAPSLQARDMRVGEMVLVMPTFMTRCLLDFFTCWSMCTNAVVDNYESRRYREQLNGGTFGDGRIFIDGFEIPLIGYDWGLANGDTRGDIYLLTGAVGGQRILHGQLLDMAGVPADAPGATYEVFDDGKILTWRRHDHTCYEQIVEMRPRLVNWAPWAQARFEDVRCAGPGLPKSPDPCGSAFPEKYLYVAECP